MKLLILFLLVSAFVQAEPLMSADAARAAVKEHDKAVLIEAESTLNARIEKAINFSANEGISSVPLEIFPNEKQFLSKALVKLKMLGYTISTDDKWPGYIIIHWESK